MRCEPIIAKPALSPTNSQALLKKPRFAHLEKFSPNFSSSSFVILSIFAILNHPCSLMVLLFLWSFSISVKYYFFNFFFFKSDFVWGRDWTLGILRNPCLSSPLTILVPQWFIIISLLFLYRSKILFLSWVILFEAKVPKKFNTVTGLL